MLAPNLYMDVTEDTAVWMVRSIQPVVSITYAVFFPLGYFPYPPSAADHH